METDPLEPIRHAMERDQSGTPGAQLNMTVALTIALLSSFQGVCRVKSHNIDQTMQHLQANKLDDRAFYQARHIRADLANATVRQLELAAQDAAPGQQAGYLAAVAAYQALAAEQAHKMGELRQQIARDQRAYDAAKLRDDQFDLTDAFLGIAVALLAVTSLTHQRWLYAVALVPATLGVLLGLAGLFAWPIEWSWLARVLR